MDTSANFRGHCQSLDRTMFWNGWSDSRQCVLDQNMFFFRTEGGNKSREKRKTNKRRRKSDIVPVFKLQKALTRSIPRRRAKQRSPGPFKQFAEWQAEKLILSTSVCRAWRKVSDLESKEKIEHGKNVPSKRAKSRTEGRASPAQDRNQRWMLFTTTEAEV